MPIPFNTPHVTGHELRHLREVMRSQRTSGDGTFTRQCQQFFERRYGFGKCLLTTSCTDALEMAALLCGIEPGDEVIAPAYTFVSTVNAFVLRGAVIRFADSKAGHPNMDVDHVQRLITPKTKAIICVHYAGMACDMEHLKELAARHGLFLIEDAAQAIDSTYNGKPLGSFGHFATFSFHETKNIACGEGGMLVVNDPAYWKRAEIIREKGTNRSAFFRGEVSTYSWVDIGSSFLPSDLTAAYLYAQLEHLDVIQEKRIRIWENYHAAFAPLEAAGRVELPQIPQQATVNGQAYYLVCKSRTERDALLAHLKTQEIQAVFHYLSLHTSPYFQAQYQGEPLVQSDRYSDCLVRLPFYYGLRQSEQRKVIGVVRQFFES